MGPLRSSLSLSSNGRWGPSTLHFLNEEVDDGGSTLLFLYEGMHDGAPSVFSFSMK